MRKRDKMEDKKGYCLQKWRAIKRNMKAREQNKERYTNLFAGNNPSENWRRLLHEPILYCALSFPGYYLIT